MKLLIKLETLKKATKAVAAIKDKHFESSNIKLIATDKSLIVSTIISDLEYSKSLSLSEIEETGVIYINKEELNKTLSKLPKVKEVLLETTDNFLTLSNHKFDIKLELSNKLTDDGINVDSKITSFNTATLLDCLIKGSIASLNDGNAIHDSTCLELGSTRYRVASVDGKRLTVAKGHADESYLVSNEIEKTEAESVLLTSNTIKVLIKELKSHTEKIVDIRVSDNYLQLETSNAKVVCRRVDGRFPGFDRILDGNYINDPVYSFTVQSEELREPLSTIVTLSEKNERDLRIVKVETKQAKEELIITGKKRDNEYSFNISTLNGHGNDIEVFYNAAFLQDILKVFKRVELQFTLERVEFPTAIRINDDNVDFTYALMPIIFEK